MRQNAGGAREVGLKLLTGDKVKAFGRTLKGGKIPGEICCTPC